MKRLALVLLSMTFAGAVLAQQPQRTPQASPSVAPANAARNVELSPDGAVNAALQVAQMIDAGRVAELWDGASAVTRRLVQKQAFVDGVNGMRAPHGVVQGRAWMVVRRQQVADTRELPAGIYVSVEFATQAAGKVHPNW